MEHGTAPKDVKEMSTAEMIVEYNLLTKKSIKKFSSREAGEKQLSSARTVAAFFSGATPATPIASVKPAKVINTKPSAKPSKKTVNSEAKHVKNNVMVGDKQYNSVMRAFEELKLPLQKHIKFRALLKKEKTAIFEHENKKYSFSIV